MQRRKVLLGLVGLLLATLMLTGCPRRERAEAVDIAGITGPFDWRRAAGSEITVFMVQHPTTESIMARLSDFTDLTGIRVNTSITPEANYFDQVSIVLSARTGMPDLFMSGAYQLWDYYTAYHVQPLDVFLNNASLTHADYDVGDFVRSAFDALKWDGVTGSPVGRGNQLGIPLAMELYMLGYNRRAFDIAGIANAPRTFDELLGILDRLQGWNGPGSYAIAVRGARDWGTIHPAYMSTFRNFGAVDFEMEGGRLVSRVNSPESVRMNEFFVDMIRRGGSPQWASMFWYLNQMDFQNGFAAMHWDASNVLAQSVWANTAESPHIRFAPSPVANIGDPIHSNFWTWAMAMNYNSRNQVAAWKFLQFFSSKEFLLSASVDSNNMDPTRDSVFNHPDFRARLDTLPNWYESWRATVPLTTILFTPHPAFFAATTEWAAHLQDMVAGGRFPSIQAGLDSLKETQDRLLLGH